MVSSSAGINPPTSNSYHEVVDGLRRVLDTLPREVLTGALGELSSTVKEGREEEIIKVGKLALDLCRYQASLDGSILSLTLTEFKLLTVLVQNRGRTLSREQLMDRVWSWEYEQRDRTVDVYIRSLREKIEDDPRHPRHLLTVRGIGYRFEQI